MSWFLVIAKSLFSIVIILCLISLAPLRLKIREIMMRNLAKEFHLEFVSNNPSFFDFYFKILWWRSLKKGAGDVNVMHGTVAGHQVRIHDVFIAYIWDWLSEPTYLEIDGKVVMGKYEAGKLGNFVRIPVYELRKILKKIS